MSRVSIVVDYSSSDEASELAAKIVLDAAREVLEKRLKAIPGVSSNVSTYQLTGYLRV